MNSDQSIRYSRQTVLPQVGKQGQQRLSRARVVIIGAGGLGVPVALYLAGAGVGHLTLVDDDVVDLSNLQRQVVFTTDDVGRLKAETLAAHLRRQNDTIVVHTVSERLTSQNIENVIAGADLLVDCCDNFATRYLINDFCRALGKPWIFAAVHQFRGHFALFTPETACFRCVYPTQPVTEGNCSLAGVLGTVPGLMGLWQANEALKYVLELPESRPGHLWQCDVLDLRLKPIQLTADPECWCADKTPNPRIFHSHPAEQVGQVEIDWQAWRNLCASGEAAELIDVRDEAEHNAANVGGRWLPHDDIPRHLETLDHNIRVALYCQRGMRSLALANELRARGFKHVMSIRGGIERWH